MLDVLIPARKVSVSFMTKIPTFEALQKYSVADLLEVTAGHSKTHERIDSMKSNWAERAKFVGKAMAALLVKFGDMCNAGKLAPGTTFKDWHRKETSSAKNPGYDPDKDALTIAQFYRKMVLSGKVTEVAFDNSRADWLLNANAAISTAGDNLESKVVKDVSALFAKVTEDVAPLDMAKKLKAIKAEAKGQVKLPGEEGTKETATVDGTLVASVIRAGLQKGYHSVITSELVAEAMTASSLNEKTAKDFFMGTLGLAAAWEKSGIDQEVLRAWKNEFVSTASLKKESAPAQQTKALAAA